MFATSVFAFVALGASAAAAASSAQNSTKFLNSEQASKYWGQISPYSDNPDNFFGVSYVGLPEGCQVEQAHLLQRHAQRFPTSGEEDGLNDERLAGKVANFTKAHPGAKFTGPLAFLNSYEYQLGESLLTNVGAATEFTAGTSFWNRYGRLLYNASVSQVSYNATFQNGTLRPKPVLRTTSQSRIENSEINWALGFFGPSFLTVPDPTLSNFTDYADIVIIAEGGTENDTLAAYDSCLNDDNDVPGYIGTPDLFSYLPLYLKPATARMQKYAPQGFKFNVNDTYAMQSICAYETAYIGMSSFCDGLFTEAEWKAFEYTLDILYYYDYSFGQPTGRAQGLGYLQELLARLQHQFIPVSNSSVNSTLDDNAKTFPLRQPFYADFSHDDILVSVLTAMSLDYLRQAPSLTTYPPDEDRHFRLSNLTPFGARLITEVVSCTEADPKPKKQKQVQYYPEQYGWDKASATNKFIRLRLNNGILPIDTIRGGACDGRPDGLCGMAAFIRSQQNATALANYDFACFGNYTIKHPYVGHDYDGTISA